MGCQRRQPVIAGPNAGLWEHDIQPHSPGTINLQQNFDQVSHLRARPRPRPQRTQRRFIDVYHHQAIFWLLGRCQAQVNIAQPFVDTNYKLRTNQLSADCQRQCQQCDASPDNPTHGSLAARFANNSSYSWR